MAGVGFSVAVSGPGDREAARALLWRSARRTIGGYLGGDAYVETWEYLDNADPLAVDGDLLWMFGELGGMCTTSATAWAHWMGLAFAADWDDIASMLSRDCALTLTGPRPDLGACLTDTTHRFVTLRGGLWRVETDGLSGDGRRLRFDELQGVEGYEVDAARELCRCGMCQVLRPDDPAFANWLLDMLEEDDPRSADTAARKLVRMHETWPEVLLALIDATGRTGDDEALAALVDRYAARLPDPDAVVREYLPRFGTDVACAMADRLLNRLPPPSR
jgi:hypothetical protein